MASSSSSSLDAIIETLSSKGWCFRDVDHIKTLIQTPPSPTAIESELCNLDLRSFGAKFLPDPATLRKSSHFQGPKVLQVTSVRDISKSSIAESASGGKRLLRLKLTDGHSDVIAIEFAHIPSIPDNVAPGTKVRLENKVVMHNGILCLNAKVVTVLGGIVPSLYEEWEMNQKYAGFTRSSLKPSHSDDTGGPPPFEKLQAGAPSRRINQHSRSSDNSIAKASGPTVIEKGQRSGPSQTSGLRPPDLKAGSRDHNVNSGSLTEKTNEKQPASEARPKEVAESVPVQNQAAAQKLLQKMSNRNEGHSRGWKQRGRGKDEDDSAVLTLDEWERKRAGGSSSLIQEIPKVNQDEDLARQLQNQFDLEDFHEQRGPHVTQADDIRTSMFSFERDDPGSHGRGEFRGRGGGRGRRRGRGRGRAG
uniref:tudor domain-containing protein 3 n=1 Tax=Erigeron canadensis TaxID=72917 RepID=UPI001CB97BB3|nr:tudor domain-containing protein 3 [Erigeron canadensis]